MSKNTFNVSGNIISITRPEWQFSAVATVREDYLEEIQSVSWKLKKGRYLYNDKLGSLHSYVMKKWYGEEVCQEMKKNKYVIDHMDNVSSNCCIDNLCFLSSAYNKAKGLTFDQDNKDKRFIALTMFKDFNTGLFQITIMFNYPATLCLTGLECPSVVELAYLLYEGDYRKVIAEAQEILLDYKEDYTFKPEKLRAIDYHIEGCVGKAAPPRVHEEYLSRDHNHGAVFFKRIAPRINWEKDKKEEYFAIDDIAKGQHYQIKLNNRLKIIIQSVN